jgi:16S rRNA (cytosine967-C5)-methyltransferase
MTPGAQIQESIEALKIHEGLLEEGRFVPADRVLQGFFRDRRYMGSGDRRQVASYYYAAIRHRQTLAWWLERVTGRLEEAFSLSDKCRWSIFAHGILEKEWSVGFLKTLCVGEYHPTPLTPREEKSLKTLEGQEGWYHPQMPSWVRGNYPEFLDPFFRHRFGDQKDVETDALMGEAPLDLRVNPLKTTVRAAEEELHYEGISTTPTPFSPLGLRIEGRPPLSQMPIYKDGLIEIQDGASQLVTLLTQAQPGQAVLDLCAGAGGKTLGLAATMKNKGTLIATDIYEKRLTEGKLRLRRGGVHNVQTRLIDPENDPWLKRQAGRFDRVLVDAPCSGSGTWRRNPDLRWRFTSGDLEKILGEQRDILNRAAPLVKKGGRLVYATCSLLDMENEHQIDSFLKEHPAFKVLSIQDIWKEVLPGECPSSGPFLKTTPHQHGVDGFFAAVLEAPSS